MQVALDSVLVICGLVMLLGAKAVICASERADMSLRALSSLGVGMGGIATIGKAFAEVPPAVFDAALPVGVTLWMAHAAWQHRGMTICSATDWGALVDRAPEHREPA